MPPSTPGCSVPTLDVRRPELPLTLGQEDAHGPVQHVNTQAPASVRWPARRHTIAVPFPLVGDGLQPCGGQGQHPQTRPPAPHQHPQGWRQPPTPGSFFPCSRWGFGGSCPDPVLATRDPKVPVCPRMGCTPPLCPPSSCTGWERGMQGVGVMEEPMPGAAAGDRGSTISPCPALLTQSLHEAALPGVSLRRDSVLEAVHRDDALPARPDLQDAPHFGATLRDARHNHHGLELPDAAPHVHHHGPKPPQPISPSVSQRGAGSAPRRGGSRVGHASPCPRRRWLR